MLGSLVVLSGTPGRRLIGVKMKDDREDYDSPYFDWHNDRMFDLPTRELIDQIANDPRFNGSSACLEIVEQLISGRGEDKHQRLLHRGDFQAVFMVRESDITAIEGILRADSETEAFRHLVDLLSERPLTEEMLDSTGLLNTLLQAADRTEDAELAATLRLIACQSPEIHSQHVEAAKTGGPGAMSPATIVTVALGPYHLSGSNSRRGVMAGTRALWEAADLTTEHSTAREVVAERGAEVISLESVGNIYVATADAICGFRKSEAKEYTYVRMRFKSAVEFDLGNMVIQMPSALPALGYHREMRKSHIDPDGPEVEAIVWPIPFQPAIYALENGVVIGETGGLIAVSGGRVAIV